MIATGFIFESAKRAWVDNKFKFGKAVRAKILSDFKSMGATEA